MINEPTFRTEFPDFPVDAFRSIEGFVDNSWHNDACPSLYSADLLTIVYLDYPNPDDRDNGPDSPAFNVVVLDEEGGDIAASFEFNTWDEVLAWVNARELAVEDEEATQKAFERRAADEAKADQWRDKLK